MIKFFSFLSLKEWFEPMVFRNAVISGKFSPGSLAVLKDSGQIRIHFLGGNSAADGAKLVRTNSIIVHHRGQVKFEGVASLREARFWKGFFGLNWNWPELEKEKKKI